MQRAIYEVYAKIIDSTGAYNTLTGYPKAFDSRSYDNDVDKTYRRAEGEFSDTWGAMCKRDDRLMQTVIFMAADGTVLGRKSMGKVPDAPDAE